VAFEFLQAFARFFVDRTEFDRTIGRLETDAARASTVIEKALSATPELGPAGGVLPPEEARASARALRESAGATDELSEAQDKAGRGATAVARSVREVSRNLASELDPALGQAVGGLVSGAQAAREFSVGIGFVVGAMTVIAAVAATYVQRLREAREAQVQLSMAQLAGDFAAAQSQVQANVLVLERYAERQREIARGPGAVGGAPPFAAFLAHVENLFGEAEEELRRRAAAAAKLAADQFQAIEVPKRLIETQLEGVKVQQQAARADLERASTVEEVTAAVARNAEAIREQADLQARQQEEAGRLEGQRLIDLGMLTGEAGLVAAGKFVAEQARKRGESIRQAAEVSARELTEINQRRVAEIEALEIDAEQRRQERLRDRARLERETESQLTEIASTAAQERATFEGHAFTSVAAVFEERRAMVERTASEELDALKRVTAEQVAAIQTRLQAARGDERARLEQQLVDVTATAETEKTRITERATVERARLDAQETSARRAELERRRQLDQEYFDVLKAARVVNLQDEIARQVQLVAQTEAGTKQRLDAERRLIEQVTAMRAAQASAAAGIMGVVQQSLEEQGLTEFTAADVARTLAEVQREAKSQAGLFVSGAGTLTKEQFAQIGQVTSLQEQLGTLGQTPEQVLTGAVGQIFTAGQSPLAGSGSLLGQEFLAAIKEGMPIVTSGLLTAFMDALTTALANEARRI
jgi:hypothetical protein